MQRKTPFARHRGKGGFPPFPQINPVEKYLFLGSRLGSLGRSLGLLDNLPGLLGDLGLGRLVDVAHQELH